MQFQVDRSWVHLMSVFIPLLQVPLIDSVAFLLRIWVFGIFWCSLRLLFHLEWFGLMLSWSKSFRHQWLWSLSKCRQFFGFLLLRWMPGQLAVESRFLSLLWKGNHIFWIYEFFWPPLSSPTLRCNKRIHLPSQPYHWSFWTERTCF